MSSYNHTTIGRIESVSTHSDSKSNDDAVPQSPSQSQSVTATISGGPGAQCNTGSVPVQSASASRKRKTQHTLHSFFHQSTSPVKKNGTSNTVLVRDLVNRTSKRHRVDQTSESESASKTLSVRASAPATAAGSQPRRLSMCLTPEQIQRIEANKCAALEKLRQKNQIGFAQLEQLLSEPGWRDTLSNQFRKPYFQSLAKYLATREAQGARIFPPKHLIFRSMELCPWDSVKVVILGQDPYHAPGQAEGLSFSVPKGIAIPSSLRNIYKELGTDLPDFKAPRHGHLTGWARQGVLMLNTALTVEQARPGAHSKQGWQPFTDAAIRALSLRRSNIVFMLWGGHAKGKLSLIRTDKHLVLKCAHPSGLSAHRGFYGCKHFSKTNAYLKQHGMEPINWNDVE
jgi:uracil-DNA glycosylase